MEGAVPADTLIIFAIGGGEHIIMSSCPIVTSSMISSIIPSNLVRYACSIILNLIPALNVVRYAYSIKPNPWQWLTSRSRAEAMAERVSHLI